MVSNTPPRHYPSSTFPTWGVLTATNDFSIANFAQTAVYSNYGPVDEPSARASRRAMDIRARADRERQRRRAVVHAPPPVVLRLCTEPLPDKRVQPRPRGVAWLAGVHSGQRERRALRASVERKDSA